MSIQTSNTHTYVRIHSYIHITYIPQSSKNPEHILLQLQVRKLCTHTSLFKHKQQGGHTFRSCIYTQTHTYTYTRTHINTFNSKYSSHTQITMGTTHILHTYLLCVLSNLYHHHHYNHLDHSH